MRSFWTIEQKAKRVVLHGILHVDDSPERIAFGAALGMLVACTPTWGVQMVLAVALAAMLRANKAATLPGVWVTNPLTIVPIYWFNYKFGHLLLYGTWGASAATQARIGFLTRQTFGLQIFRAPFWGNVAGLGLEVGWPLWVGSLIIGLFLAIVTYIVVRAAVIRYRGHLAAHVPGPIDIIAPAVIRKVPEGPAKGQSSAA